MLKKKNKCYDCITKLKYFHRQWTHHLGPVIFFICNYYFYVALIVMIETFAGMHMVDTLMIFMHLFVFL